MWCGRFQRQWEFGGDWQQHLHVRWQLMKRNDVPNMENEIPMAPFVFTTETARNDTTSSSGTVTHNHCHAHTQQLLRMDMKYHIHCHAESLSCWHWSVIQQQYEHEIYHAITHNYYHVDCHVICSSVWTWNIPRYHTQLLSCWLSSVICSSVWTWNIYTVTQNNFHVDSCLFNSTNIKYHTYILSDTITVPLTAICYTVGPRNITRIASHTICHVDSQLLHSLNMKYTYAVTHNHYHVYSHLLLSMSMNMKYHTYSHTQSLSSWLSTVTQ